MTKQTRTTGTDTASVGSAGNVVTVLESAGKPMFWSIWNAPSDRDYYDPMGLWEAQESDRCVDCGADWNQECESFCATRNLITMEDLNELSDVSDLPSHQTD